MQKSNQENVISILNKEYRKMEKWLFIIENWDEFVTRDNKKNNEDGEKRNPRFT